MIFSISVTFDQTKDFFETKSFNSKTKLIGFLLNLYHAYI